MKHHSDIDSENEIQVPTLRARHEKLKTDGNLAFRSEDFWLADQLYCHASYSVCNHPVLLSNTCAALTHRGYRGDIYHGFRLAKRALRIAPEYKP